MASAALYLGEHDRTTHIILEHTHPNLRLFWKIFIPIYEYSKTIPHQFTGISKHSHFNLRVFLNVLTSITAVSHFMRIIFSTQLLGAILSRLSIIKLNTEYNSKHSGWADVSALRLFCRSIHQHYHLTYRRTIFYDGNF